MLGRTVIMVVGVLLFSNCRQVAYATLKDTTKLPIEEADFQMCKGFGRSLDNDLNCQPLLGTDPWIDASKLSIFPVEATVSAEDPYRPIVKFYLANWGNGDGIKACVAGELPFDDPSFKLNYVPPLKNEVRASSLVRESLLSEASLALRAAFKTVPADFEAAFLTNLKQQLARTSGNSATIEYVQFEWRGEPSVLERISAFQSCGYNARANKARLLTGLTGYVLRKFTGNSSVASATDFKAALDATAALDPSFAKVTSQQVDAGASAGLKWETSVQKQLSQAFSASDRFLPVWARFSPVPAESGEKGFCSATNTEGKCSQCTINIGALPVSRWKALQHGESLSVECGNMPPNAKLEVLADLSVELTSSGKRNVTITPEIPNCAANGCSPMEREWQGEATSANFSKIFSGGVPPTGIANASFVLSKCQSSRDEAPVCAVSPDSRIVVRVVP